MVKNAPAFPPTKRAICFTISIMLRAKSCNIKRGLDNIFTVYFLHFLPAFRFFCTAFCIRFCFALPVALRHFGHLLFLSVSSTSQNARQETHRRRIITQRPPQKAAFPSWQAFFPVPPYKIPCQLQSRRNCAPFQTPPARLSRYPRKGQSLHRRGR